jgi:preprotein translocase subunit SecE
MGRLQRKKITTAGKKKKQSGNQAAVAASKGHNKVAKEQDNSALAMVKKAGSVAKVSPGRDNFITRAIQFLREVRVELKKVTWPSRKQTIGSTAVVLIIVLIVSVFLSVADIGLSSLIRLILQ